jgi:hypothetical protein
MGIRRLKSDQATARILYFQISPSQSDFKEAFHMKHEYMDLMMVKVPGKFLDNGLPAFGFKSVKSDQWVSSSTIGITTPNLQEEAVHLLLDIPVPHQSLADLAILAQGPALAAPPIRRLDQFFPVSGHSAPQSGQATGEDQTGSGEVVEERMRASGPVPSHRPLDKPTTEMIEEYRRVSPYQRSITDATSEGQ